MNHFNQYTICCYIYNLTKCHVYNILIILLQMLNSSKYEITAFALRRNSGGWRKHQSAAWSPAASGSKRNYGVQRKEELMLVVIERSE